MDAPEGTRRIAKAIKWAGRLLAGLAMIGAIVTVGYGGYAYDWAGDVLGTGAFIAIVAVAIWGVSETLAWIINGFAKPRDSHIE